MRKAQFVVVVSAVIAAACQAPASPGLVTGGAGEAGLQSGTPAGSMGGGVYRFASTSDVRFDFNAVSAGNGGAAGHLFQSFEFGGLLIEFRGRVTCVSVDVVNRRAWIGGVVTENNSTHPQFTTARTQVGRDIWFRVVDYGEANGVPQPDRTTIPGFEGDRGIITSAEYCATQPWVAGDVATHPLTNGNIQVRP
jgi:hypothetical protein